ncbi:hypothetical protein [Lonepinella sp. BR2357]|uniref:hypothetical protein n=1 Tax=Lonepinella sp. BR2357 TaxID=3434549 RepID=UPI003F6DB9BD
MKSMILTGLLPLSWAAIQVLCLKCQQRKLKKHLNLLENRLNGEVVDSSAIPSKEQGLFAFIGFLLGGMKTLLLSLMKFIPKKSKTDSADNVETEITPETTENRETEEDVEITETTDSTENKESDKPL